MIPATIPAPEVVEVPGGGISSRNLYSRVMDIATMSTGAWHIATVDAYLPVEKDLLPLLAEIGHPDFDVWDTSRVAVTPTWSHDHAVAALGALVDRLDELGGGLFIEVRPYHNATAQDRRNYVAWLVDRGFRVVLGTRRRPTVMYRGPGGGGR